MTLLEDQLNNALKEPSIEERINQYKKIAESLIHDCAKIEIFVHHLISHDSAAPLVRQILSDLAPIIDKQDNRSEILQVIVNILQTRGLAFIEQLADEYQAQEMWREAVDSLILIPLDSGHRAVTDVFKINIYIRIVQLFLEMEDNVSAETYLNRASLLMSKCNDALMNLKFKVSQVRILDYKRKFIEAAYKYYDLSFLVDESEKNHCLSQSIICTILASAGSQRSQMLSLLIKDDRVNGFPLHSMLVKVYNESILRKPMIAQFSACLAPHQKALIGHGLTVLDRAMMEHNIHAASKIYKDIYLSELAKLIESSDEKTEEYVAKLISEKSIDATIDRVDKIVDFKHKDPLRDWNDQIKDICNHIQDIVGQ